MKTAKNQSSEANDSKKLLNEIKKDIHIGLNASQKSLDYYKRACDSMLQVASISAITKKVLINNINTVFEKSMLSASYIKRVRGCIMNFFEGAKKYPSKIEVISIRLGNISSFKELEALSKNFKNHGESEVPQKENKSNPKNKEVEIKVNPIDGNTIDRIKYYTFIERVIKVDDKKLDTIEDDKIIAVFDECIKISKMLGGVEG